MTEYSPLKVFHHTEKLNQLRKGLQPTPCQVQLVISDLCNQNCHFCAYRSDGYSSNQLFTLDSKLASFGHNNPIRVIEFAKIIEILDDCVRLGIPAIQLTGGGEPSAHPFFNKVLKAILDRGLDLGLVTNGVNLASALDTLSGAKWIRVSVDAGRAETYCRIRGVSEVHWTKVWENLSTLCQNKIEDDPVVGVGFVVTLENYREIFECASRAKDCGASNFRISAVFQDEGAEYFRDFFDEASEQCQKVKSLEDESFRVFDLFGERLEDLNQKSPDYHFCGIQNFVTYIGGDLNVYRCCVLSYNEDGKIGSLKNQRLYDLWTSTEKQQNFANFDATHCPKCMFNSKNRTILYALETKPRHVNFV